MEGGVTRRSQWREGSPGGLNGTKIDKLFGGFA